jgi:hypothetical protein
MTRLALTLLILFESTSAFAARPLTLGMTCQQAQNMVASRGAVVMSTGQHTYDRFVANPGFCEVAEWAYTATAPTKDTRSCRLGYVCKSTPPIWYDGPGSPGNHWLFGD